MPWCQHQHLQQSHRIVATGANGETGLAGQSGLREGGTGGTALPTTQEPSQGSSPAITSRHTHMHVGPFVHRSIISNSHQQRSEPSGGKCSPSEQDGELQEMGRHPAPGQCHSADHLLALTSKDFSMKSQSVRLHRRWPY